MEDDVIKKVNKAYVEALPEMINLHNGRFVLALVLCDDGRVDAMKNIHTVSEPEFIAALKTFVKGYSHTLENLDQDGN